MSRPAPTRPAGDYVLVCDKPAGVTSHDVVASVRRTLPRKTKVGHAGTLDPFATGVLLVLVGRATRAQRFFMALRKRYEAIARFGAVSSTGDVDGEITATGVIPRGDLVLPTGVIRQRPPAYSAVKVGGRRAYEFARAGETVALAEREVTVYRFDECWRDGDRRAFAIECSSGTYVRALIAELGDAYCEALRRTGVGPFEVADADDERPVALADALGFLPAVTLDSHQGWRAAHGQALGAAELGIDVAALGDGPVRLVDPDGLVALAVARGRAGADGEQASTLRPTVGLRG